MKKINQKGFAGPVEIAIIVLVVAVVGFAAFRIGSANSDSDTNANNTSETEDSTKNELTVAETKEEPKEIVEVPKEQEEAKPVEVKPEPVKVEEKPQEEVKKDYTYISFVDSQGGQDGPVVGGQATLESPQTGECTVKFYNPPNETIYIKSEINNSLQCEGEANISQFGAAGEWEVFIYFDSSDGKVKAWNDTFKINVTL